ncbi:hypothetical protein [Novosphingobium cyanobacteriorum]|uniref:Porin domain-containing protein n=1 Tax=Novosphingobium cyanobacteriorum TaxID=3024215 RepID=A0ABT6CI39_9SPHN|nr:hypothetical protein [Novosphingobium cyanobacteriorum]MDF8333591.1 hypothetical protein [Novosphingobium cyanobacteriorum]
MSGLRANRRKGGSFSRFARVPLLAGAFAAVALFVAPTVSGAVTGKFDSEPVSLAARGGIGSFTPASVDPRLATQLGVPVLGHGKMFRFTPAGSDNRPGRAVTVAVRVDGEMGIRVVGARNAFAMPATAAAPGAAPVRIAPMVYNLGLARGYQSFASTGALPREQRLETPELRSYSLATSGAQASPGRLSPRVVFDDRDRAGRAPRTLEGQGDYQLDLGGSYRLTRNLNVTAGVRYSPERDRLRPLTDGKQDSQAVYIGTQFRF